jgi:hypothetical protein
MRGRLSTFALTLAALSTLTLTFPLQVDASVVLAHSNTSALSQGLVGYWTLDGSSLNWTKDTAADSSGQGNTGTLVSMSTTTSPTAGKIGGALNFNGSDYMTFTSASQLGLASAASEKTISAWVITTATDAAIVELRSAGGGTVFDLSIGANAVNNNGTGRPTILVRDDGGGGLTSVNATRAVNDGKWHHVVVTRNSSQLLTLYIDGVSNTSGTDTMAVAMTPDIANSAIGKELLTSGVTPMVGSIDDIRIYNRALSPQEVALLYALGSVKAGNTPITSSGFSIANIGINSGLVGYWPLDGQTTNWKTDTTADLSGQNNTSTLVSMSTSTSPVPGKTGQALKFNGSSSYIDVPNASGLNFGTGSFSASAWFKTSQNRTNFRGVFDKENGAAYYQLMINKSDGELRASINDSGGHFDDIKSSAAFDDGKWHLGIIVRDTASGKFLLYADGVVVASTVSAATGSLTNTADLTLGLLFGGSYYFNGPIDDVRIYNRALSPQEITQLYAQGAANVGHSNAPVGGTATGINSGLVGYWTFDGNNSNWRTDTTADSSGNGNTGALVSMSITTSPVPGKIGGALKFNGTSQLVAVNDSASLEVTGSLTISAWIRTTNTSASYREIVRKSDSGGPPGYFLTLNAANKIALTTSGVVGEYDNGFTYASDGKWHLVTGSFNGTTCTLYLDGVSQISYACGALTTDTSELAIGALFNFGNPVHEFPGSIDDVRVYNRALSAQEVQQLYLMGK